MAADKKPIIVIKKITVNAAGHHGGSWKVAFADFMTAMMAFFLVMWLVNQSEEVKKSVSDYFSTPSIIEYNFSNYGVELTLEKLFMDLMNEPLKAFEQFITPVDRLPNIMDMGTKKIQLHFMAEKLGEFAMNVDVNPDEITFEIPDENLFLRGTARPAPNFVAVMERVRAIVEGLKDSDLFINSELPFTRTLPKERARNVSEERLDIVLAKIETSIQGQNVDIYGKTTVESINPVERRSNDRGSIKFRIKQKDLKDSSGAKTSSSRGVSTQPEEAVAADNSASTEEAELDSFADKMAAPTQRPQRKSR